MTVSELSSGLKSSAFGAWWASDRSAAWRGMPGLISTYSIGRLLLILIPLGLVWYPGGTLVGNDMHLYWSWSEVLMSGHYPMNDPMWQYPPLAAFVFFLGAHLPGGASIGFITLALLVDFAIFYAVLRVGRSRGTLAGAWVYAWGGLLVGPVLLTRFDLFPTLFAVLALLCMSKPVRGGIMLGIGALLKVWPAFLIVSFSRRQLPRVFAGMMAIVAVVSVMLVSWGPGAGTFLGGQGSRGLQIESVGAAPYVLASWFGYDLPTIFRYGSLEIDATGAGLIASIVALAGFVAMGWIAYLRLRGKLERVSGADIALVLVLISIASSRVFSPQYMVWVLGIAAVCAIDPKSTMRPIIWLLGGVAFFGQLVYPFFYGAMMDGSWEGVLPQMARIGLLLTATIWATAKILRQAKSSAKSEPHTDTIVISSVTNTGRDLVS